MTDHKQEYRQVETGQTLGKVLREPFVFLYGLSLSSTIIL